MSPTRRRAAAHARFILTAVASQAAKRPRRRRSLQRQWPRRRLEAYLRRRSRAFAHWLAWQGRPLPQAAEALGLGQRTLRHWLQAAPEAEPTARGRPLQVLDAEQRNQVIAAIMLTGGEACTLNALVEGFPGYPRRALQECLDRYRHAWRRRAKRLVHVLRWRRPGSVWAIDHTHPPGAIDGRFPMLLNVRDLASGCTILSLPTQGETAAETAAALESLFREHEPPLVLKCDNGPAFNGAETRAICQRFRVIQLFNPARTPADNGACEAGHGGIKTRAHHFAASRGQPGRWSCDDVEAARLQANTEARPLGPAGPDAATRWASRLPANEDERLAFNRCVTRYRERVQEECQANADHHQPPKRPPTDAHIQRTAIARALIECNLLTYHRRRISPPGTHRFSAKIS